MRRRLHPPPPAPRTPPSPSSIPATWQARGAGTAAAGSRTRAGRRGLERVRAGSGFSGVRVQARPQNDRASGCSLEEMRANPPLELPPQNSPERIRSSWRCGCARVSPEEPEEWEYCPPGKTPRKGDGVPVWHRARSRARRYQGAGLGGLCRSFCAHPNQGSRSPCSLLLPKGR